MVVCKFNEKIKMITANADLITFRNGQQTTQPTYSNIGKTETTKAQVETRKNAAKNAGQAVKKGLHEPWWWYDSCNWRERNKGLWYLYVDIYNKKKVN